MKFTTVPIKSGSWCGDREIALQIPSHWNLTVHDLPNRESLSPTIVTQQLNGTTDGLTLGSLLQPSRRVVVVIDDHTRPTPVHFVLPALIERIRSSGIPANHIKVLVSVGTHKFSDFCLMKPKIGPNVPPDVEIVYPNCTDHSTLRLVNVSTSGVPIYINRHFADADVRIAVSGIYPHDEVAFSGGAKILIGILGLETLSRIHRKYGLIQRGSNIENNFRMELESVAESVGLSFSINCVLNRNKEISGLFCGRFREAFRAAVNLAEEDYCIRIDPQADVVISNAYPLDTALCVLGKSKWPFRCAKSGAYKVLVTALCNCPTGRVALASNSKERLVQHVKSLTGVPALKRASRYSATRLRNILKADSKWQQPYVVHVPYVASSTRRRPKLIDNCHVEYHWESIISDLLYRLGASKPANVSLYACAPMLFASTSEGRTIHEI